MALPFETVGLFLKLGCVGFGGPLAHLALMEQEVVEKRRWLSKERFLEGWALCQMLPGPASTQLGVYIGYVKGGFSGAILTGLAFLLPGFLLMVGLSAVYARYGNIPKVQGAFYGISPTVIAIVAFASYRLGVSALTTFPLFGLGAAATLLTFLFKADTVLVLLLAGLFGVLCDRPPLRGAGLGLLIASPLLPPVSTFGSLAWIFLKAGAFVYGGGYVVIPFIQGEVVERLGWMTVRTFVDGLAIAQVVPGPIVNISAFVGYQVAVVPGAVIAAASVFTPAFAFILAAVPLMERLRRSIAVQAFFKGVNAAAVGAIVGATLPLAKNALVDLPTLGIATLSFLALWRFKVPAVYLVLASGLLGLLLR
ncbi:MAG: chromate efflux transporter [candidate division NC10 bacterium]|nr:chromate efflux transporter [candidate division NC10 bacterium]